MSLSKTSVGMGQIVGQALANKGIELAPVPGTALESLVDISTAHHKVSASAKVLAGEFERPELTVSMLSASDEIHGEDTVPVHTTVMADAVSDLSRQIAAALDLAQNTVNPTIKRVVESVTAAVDAASQASGSPLEILEKRPDPILDSVYLQESVLRYNGRPRDASLRSFGIAATDILDRLSTGHAGMDEQITEFLGRVSTDFAASVWNCLFNSSPASSMDVYARPSQVNAAVLAYFFAAKAAVEIPDGLNVELSEWREYCSRIVSSAGAAISASYDDRAKARKFGALVVHCPSETTPTGYITVDGDKYAEFLAQGGTPELIFGAAYGDRNFETSRLLANAEKLTKEWARVLSMFRTSMAYKAQDAMINGLRAAISAEINALPENLQIGDKAVYHSRLQDMLPQARARDMADLWDLSRRFVCRVIYPNSDSEALLLAIDEQGKFNPSMPEREMALCATIELVARWVAKQVIPTRHV